LNSVSTILRASHASPCSLKRGHSRRRVMTNHQGAHTVYSSFIGLTFVPQNT